MKTTTSRLEAVLEVLAVRIVILVLGVAWYRSAAGQWQVQALGHWFGSHALFTAVPLLLLWVTRRPLADYGLTLYHWREDVRAALGALFPVALSAVPLSILGYTTWRAAIVLFAVQLGVLWAVERALRGKPDVASGLWTIGLSVLLFGGYGLWKGLSPAPLQALGNVVYYLLFVGLGEEVMNRGYTLTRLNQAFGKPYAFGQVRWGWGTILAAVLFGASHLANGYNPITGVFHPPWPWAFWTAAAALYNTYVREKTGSLLAPTILHGLPQALVYAFLVRW